MNYFDNDWEAVAETPEERFATPLFEEVLGSATCWDLPSEYVLVVRVQNPKTLKVKEKVFKRVSSADKFCKAQLNKGLHVTAYTDDRLFAAVEPVED